MNLDTYTTLAKTKRKVYLHGYLADKFGDEFDLAVQSPAEAVRLLSANFPSFCDEVRKGQFHVIVAGPETGMKLTLEMVHFKFPKGSIHLVPVPQGASGGSGGGTQRTKGIITIILGVALIATAFVGAGFLAGGFAGAGWGTALGSSIFGGVGVTWGQVGLLGLALTFAGIAILLTPTPKKNKTDDSQSFFFNGAANSAKEGVPVPIVYGRVQAGSVIVHGGVFDDSIAINTVYPAVQSFDQ